MRMHHRRARLAPANRVVETAGSTGVGTLSGTRLAGASLAAFSFNRVIILVHIKFDRSVRRKAWLPVPGKQPHPARALARKLGLGSETSLNSDTSRYRCRETQRGLGT